MSSKKKSTRGAKRVTIYDVAREAGVAPSTVSRTFSRPGRVNAETAARVRKVAEKIGYRAATVSFTSAQSTQLIAVAVPDIANPTYAETIKGIRREALAAGYSTILLDAAEIDDQNSETLERSMGLAEGLILVSPRLPDSAIQQMAKQRPVVTLNREVPGVPAVISDAKQGVLEMVAHLYNLGHRSLTFLPGPRHSYDDAQRWQALLEQCSRRKMAIRRTPPRRPTVAGGAAAAREWMQRRTSAVIAHNDLMAMGFMIAVKSVGIDVPADVSVVGTDNIFMSALVTPPLTTVTASRRTQGSLAFGKLLEQLRHQHREVGHLTTSVQMKLVERESTDRAHNLHR
ncbi:MAG: LacI family DNA-binding transcriptional regulator [Lawsonella sp.]|nr:LacI family transcriptional regulator [Mycobacteriales bacterium]